MVEYGFHKRRKNMYKISEFDFLNDFNEFSYTNNFTFYSTAFPKETLNKKFLYYLEDIKYLIFIENHDYNIAAIITTPDVAEKIKKKYNIVLSNNPEELYFLIHNNLKNKKEIKTIIGKNCKISDLSKIETNNVKIGNNVCIEEFVSIKENVEIGDNTLIKAGTIIGGEGFHVFKQNGIPTMVKHHGSVKIGDNVTIGSNCTIDKGMWPHVSTILENNVKTDNKVHIGHNAKIKENVRLAAGTTLSGYCIIGKNTFCGVNSAVRQLVTVGENNFIGMGAFVNKDTENNQIIVGNQGKEFEEAKILNRKLKKL